MPRRLYPLISCATLLFLAAGCSHTPSHVETPPTTAPARLASTAPRYQGSVLEIIQTGKYTYINVDNGSTQRWFCLKPFEVEEGQRVELQPGLEVKNYTTKCLNRTFKVVCFADGLRFVSSDAPPAPVVTPASTLKTVSGRVVEVFTGSDLKFVLVEKGAEKEWVAVPSTEVVKVGQELQFLPGKEIFGFNGDSVKRTFDKIVISDGVEKR